MTKLNHSLLRFLSTSSALLTAALGFTLGACDPKMIGDETQGNGVCKDGETMPAEDGCNDCTCVNGAWACTEKACDDSGLPAMCEDGEVKPAGDGCNDCTCFNDAWACTKKACEPDACQPGETKMEDCNTCSCNDGQWLCTAMACNDALCGDGVVGGAELCDDGNKVDDDACPNDCGLGGTTGQMEPGDTDTSGTGGDTDTGGTDTGGGVCGDGVVDPGESCDDGNAVDDDACPNDCVLGGGGACLPDDPYKIVSAAVEADALKVELTYGGGCETHLVDMCWDGIFAESFPVQTWVALSHEDNDDPCDALLTEMHVIDLGAMKTAYQQGYQTQNGTIVIHLDGWPQNLEYTF